MENPFDRFVRRVHMPVASDTREHVVMFSGGAGSWAAAKLVAEKYGTDRLTLLFADTKMEDEDLYRFIHEAAANVGGKLVIIADGRTPWQVAESERFIPNTRVDICSRILKRKICRDWLTHNRKPENTMIHLGIDWSEMHRYENSIPHWLPWSVFAPLCEPPFMDKAAMLEWLGQEGIAIPRLYTMGFPHNNCGGFCVKAGKAHFAHLLAQLPERYLWHEAQEERLRSLIGKNVAIMREVREGVTYPLTMRELRERLESKTPIDLDDDWGGCGCFSPQEDTATGDAPFTVEEYDRILDKAFNRK